VKVRAFLLAVWVIPLTVRAGDPPVSAVDSANAGKRPISPLLQKFEVASCHRDEKTALALIDQGLDTREADPWGNTALALAMRFQSVAVVKALVAHGADVHLRIANSSILGFAIQSRSAEKVAFLLAQGVGANEPIDDNNRTPLMEAAKRGQMEMVTLLLAQGADVKAHSKDGVDALDDAADYGYADIIGLLIDRGADPNRGGLHGDMPLNWAARAGYLNAVKMLVQKGAKPDAPSGPGNMTPLSDACCGDARPGRDQVGVIQFLLQNGAKVSTPDKNGTTPLMHAATEYGRLDIIKTLVAAGADIHSADGEGAKAFREVIEVPYPDALTALESLLQAGADPNWQVQNGYSALFYAIQIRPNADIVAALARAKVDVNATRHQPSMGEFVGGPPPDYVYSALIAAVKADSVPIAKALLEAGANAHYQDSEGKTALDRAREKKNPEMIALLAKYS
jgi:ankyrin repeat protein